MIVPQVTLSMDVTKVDAQAFEFFVNPIQSQNLQIWQGYHLSIFKSYVFLQNLEGIAQELNMRLLGYCGRWISHEGPLQGSGTSIIPNSDPPSSLSYRTTPLVPVAPTGNVTRLDKVWFDHKILGRLQVEFNSLKKVL